MIYKNASYASWPDDKGHTIAKGEGEGEVEGRGKCFYDDSVN